MRSARPIPTRHRASRLAAVVALAVALVATAAAPALAEGPGYGGDADALVVTVVSTDESGPGGDRTPAPTLGDAPDATPATAVEATGGPGYVRAAVFTDATVARRRLTTLRLEARGFLAGSPMKISVPGGQVVARADRFGALDTQVQAAARHGRVRVRGLDADLEARALEATIPTGAGGTDPRPLVFGTLGAVAIGIALTPIARRRWAP